MSSWSRTGRGSFSKVLCDSPLVLALFLIYFCYFLNVFWLFVGSSNVYPVVLMLQVNNGDTQVLPPSLFETSYHTASSQGRAHIANSKRLLLMSHF